MYRIMIKKYKRFLYYTFCFLILMTFLIGIFYFNGKSFIEGEAADALTQHYNYFLYIGQWYRQILHNIFIEHNFLIPLWDISFGYGGDIISQLHYYVFGDPLMLLSILFNEQTGEFGFSLIIILRIYLSGLSFLLYTNYMKYDKKYSWLCALMYAFCGFSLYAGFRHPYFINPMIYFPLVCKGIEKIYKNEKPYFFIIVVFVSTISNFYFFYMISLFMFFYAIYRYIKIFKKLEIKSILFWLFKFIVFYSIGVLIASLTFIPSITFALNSSRVNVDTALYPIYSIQYYGYMFITFISAYRGLHFTSFGYSFPVLICLLYLIKHLKEYKLEFINFILCFICLSIPMFGYIFNGFTYIANRYMWAISFFACLLTCRLLPEILKIKKKEQYFYIIVCILYTFVALMGTLVSKEISFKAVIICFGFTVISVILIFYLHNQYKIGYKMIIVTSCLSIMLNMYSTYIAYGYVNKFLNTSTSKLARLSNSSQLLDSIEDDSYYRYDFPAYNKHELKNSNISNENIGINYYSSSNNALVSKFLFHELEYGTSVRDYEYKSLDSREELLAISSVKYFYTLSNEKSLVPTGYKNLFDKTIHVYNGSLKNIDTVKKKYTVYENEYALPFGYTYSSYILRKDYEKLSALEKQEALLQGCIVDDNIEELSQSKINTSVEVVPFTITDSYGMEIHDNQWTAIKKDSYLTLKLDKKYDDLYMHFIGLDTDTSYSFLKENSSDVSHYLQIDSGDYSRNFEYRNNYTTTYTGLHNFLEHLGKTNSQEIKVTLKQGESFVFDKIEILTKNNQNYINNVSKLNEVAMTDLNISNNLISGNIESNTNRMVCLSIPNNGWECYIDGKKSDTYTINTFMIGILVTKGKHNITLKYQMPYIKEITLLTAIGLVGFISISIYYKKRKG